MKNHYLFILLPFLFHSLQAMEQPSPKSFAPATQEEIAPHVLRFLQDFFNDNDSNVNSSSTSPTLPCAIDPGKPLDEQFLNAAFDDQLDTMKYLVSLDRSLIESKNGERALNIAAYRGHNHIVEYFLSNGAN